MIKGKRGSELLTQDVIFITLNVMFLAVLITFLTLRVNNSALYEETYAKEIALILDSAKPGMVIHFNMQDGLNIAVKEFGKDNLNETVKIDGNIVTVKLTKNTGYSYSFFNNVDVRPYINAANNKEAIFLIGDVSETVQSTDSENLLTMMNYAKTNRVVNRNCNCGNNCGEYAGDIAESSDNNGIDPVLFLAIMMQESECTANAFSGSSTGLMQINLIHCGEYGLPADKTTCKSELINDAKKNIEVGAEILKDSYNTYKNGKLFQGCQNRNIVYYDWDAALRGYNGWGCGVDSQGNTFTAQDNYVEDINQRYAKLNQI